MVEFSRLHLQEGHLAIMWRDTAFNYAYYLWFEDISVSTLLLLLNDLALNMTKGLGNICVGRI